MSGGRLFGLLGKEFAQMLRDPVVLFLIFWLTTAEVATTYFATDGAPTDDLSKFAWTTHETHPENVTDKNTAAVQAILNDAHTAIMTGSSSIDDALAQAAQRVHDEVGIG